MERLKAIKLDHDENAVRPAATFAEVGHSLQGHRPLMYVAKAPRFPLVYSSFVKKRKASSATVWTVRQSNSMISNLSKALVRFGVESLTR